MWLPSSSLFLPAEAAFAGHGADDTAVRVRSSGQEPANHRGERRLV